MAEMIHSSPRSLVYRDFDEDLDAEIVWKICGSSKKHQKFLENEYNLSSAVSIEGLRTPVRKGLYENSDAFAYDFFEGQSISALCREKTFTLHEFLRAATRVVRVINEMHRNGLFHLRLSGTNILYNTAREQVQIIDLSGAARSLVEATFDLEDWGEELPYMAPEQSGRLSQKQDARTDLYALGVVFHEMLTGSFPLKEERALDQVHAILTKAPQHAREVDNRIPEAISDILQKLLSKDPADRYQTAFGLLNDLEQCRARLKEGKELKKFELGNYDRTGRLQLSEKIYGREKEIEVFRHLLQSASVGLKEVMLIEGPSGIGKTALLSSIKEETIRKNGVFVSGRFDQVNADTPYQAMIRALKETATLILSQKDKDLLTWKERIQNAVGDIGQVLIDLIPEYEWIIGSQSDVEVLDASQSVSRLNFLFERLVVELTRSGWPIVLALDDLQWIEPASWANLQSIIANPNIGHFVLVLSYRRQEKEEIQVSLDEIVEYVETSASLNKVSLGPLGSDDLERFVSDSIYTDRVSDLAKLIYAKTNGFPFFMHEFLQKIHKEGALFFVPEENKWSWDGEAADKIFVTDNVVEEISAKLTSLSEDKLKLINFLSCINDIVGVAFIQEIHGEEEKWSDVLSELVDERILITTDGLRFDFLHERLRETAYATMKKSDRASWHHEIASVLLKSGEEYDTSLFQMAGHYRLGAKNIVPEEKEAVLGIFYRAGLEAIKTAAFNLAFDYLSCGVELCSDEDWKLRYEATLNLYIEAAEAAMVNGNSEMATEWIDEVLQKARSTSDRVRAHEIRLNYLTESHQFGEAVAQLLLVLEEIGYPVKRNPSQLSILKEFAMAKMALRGKKIADIPNLPQMEDEFASAFLRLTVKCTTSIFGSASDILPIIIFRQVRLSAKYGNSPYSAYAYCSYGFALSVFQGQIDQGYEWGQMALRLVDSMEDKPVHAKALVIFYGFLSFWKDGFRSSIEPLMQAYKIGRQSGDLLYASFAANFNALIRMQTGDHLPDLLRLLNEDTLVIKNLNQELVYWVNEILRQFTINLIQEVDDPVVLGSEGFSETELLNRLDEIKDTATQFDFYYYKVALATIYNRYEDGFENANQAGVWEDATTARQTVYPSYLLFSSISAFRYQMNGASPKEKKQIEKQLKKRLKLLRTFSKHGPQNFENKYELVRALMAYKQGKNTEAAAHFNASISKAMESRFVHEEAVVREQFAYFYFDQGNRELGELMLRKAYEAYRSWGATAKCEQLIKNYGEELGSKEISVSRKAGLQTVFDLNTIIEANQALSSQNTLQGLIETTIDVFWKNASSTKLVFLLKQEEEYNVVGIGRQGSIEVIDRNLSEAEYPESLVLYMDRSRQTYVSADLGSEKNMEHDEYVRKNQPRSVVCVPLMTSDRILGAIYLENNLAEGAFDESRIEFFETIAAQLAISLDNVLLYSELEQKVMDRTAQLSEEKKKSDDLLLNILPRETAEELKNYGRTSAKRYESATVLFTDIQGFSIIAESLKAEELVSELDMVFKKFDEICLEFGLEKIKTIGDSYMAAGGVPQENAASALDVVRAAQRMQEFIIEQNSVHQKEGGQVFETRIGIHTGPVVAGVVGINKFQFDIWGSTVNVASRMESSSETDKINISQATYELVKDEIPCTHRGKIEAKNIGEIDMYYVD
jgi:predicted ATPase/class 3 adenylate cyclase